MYNLDFLLLVGACICFALSAASVKSGRLNLTALGLLLATLTLLV